MATSIPTFRLEVTEGMIDADTSADRLYGYCIEANKGPVMEPTFCASATEAKRVFGIDFLPHFYQNPTGIVICRVEFDGMSKASVDFKAKPLNEAGTAVDENGTEFTVLTISSTSEGPSNARVVISKSSASNSGYNVAITTDVTSKTYQNVPNLEKIVYKINHKFGNYLYAELSPAYKSQVATKKFLRDQFVFATSSNVTTYGYLTDGSNGVMRNTDGTVSTTQITPENMNLPAGASGPNPEMTRLIAYQKAFEKIQEVDLMGIATICDSPAVQSALASHIEEVTDPEVHQLRFGITGYTGYKKIPEDGTSLAESDKTGSDDIIGQASILDSEWMIFIGQGVVFEDEYGVRRDVLPCEATQLYTGIRSALGYSEAIFGGESKKVLNGVIDTLPVVTDGSIIDKELIEELNESGVCTFKKEYGEITFIEGVTTIQDRDVLSYENMMSIVAYVSKRLIKVAKPYQGRILTEDLKSTLTTALLKELKDITDTDGTLMELEDFNIPPYNVKVEAATKTTFDEMNNLIRVSKIIIKCRIVPVGALRDIDLGIIAI